MISTGTMLRTTLALGLSITALPACGGSDTGASGTTASYGASTSGGSAGTNGSGAPRTPDARTLPALDPLRPEPVQSALAAVTRDPQDSEAYARGALAYADTDVPGMALVWGQDYRILDTHGRKTVDVANAMARVIRERFTVSEAGQVDARLAPAGRMPIIDGYDERTYGPFAYVYQYSMDSIPNPNAPLDQYEGASAVFAGQLQAICRSGRPVLDDPLYDWLCDLAAAGHADTYGHWVIGPAFGPGWEAWRTAHARELDAYESFLQTHPYRPRRATRPDDLHPIRRGG